MGLLAFPNSINLGGMHHRGRRSYVVESTGCLYLILFVVLFFIDIEILQPVIRNDVVKVGTDERQVPIGNYDNPTYSEFRE